ncbi:tetratricopeptide repeat protein [Aestuariirhabdus sp. Z084]|uniref:tetratricopeptide repeat protein n=1 Tax=Aestuariirhabdus haliotis TaxID=2918751 RepID=UPI00201B3B47|nr:tetratricopeptide repeat protein [Aestuariirhabdus haliotis]MCL6417332.1 tetratricopeptide repeat protein [Aestuariirhabdus haliotis]MCL6421277.1 tetratricopeptide repeat protein [Aestuariirhabdus haliotis]
MEISQRLLWLGSSSRWLVRVVAMALLLSGCASNPQYYYVPEEDPGLVERPVETHSAETETLQDEERQYSYVDPVPDVVSERPSSVEQLVRQSDHKLRNSRYEEAASLLERALRISPSDADLYYRLGTVRLRQGRYAQAEQLARRGMSLSHDSRQRQDLQRLVDLSQKGQG